MDFEIPWRRIATGGLVLLLHVLFIFALIVAMRLPITQPIRQMREIMLTLMSPEISKKRLRDLNIPTPKLVSPEYVPNAITLPPLQHEAQPEETKGDLGGVGRYLYNCSGAYYEQLSAHDRTGCLMNKWDDTPLSPLLGVARPSPFDAIIAKRQPPQAGHRDTCDQTAINSNLGLPCFHFAH